MGRTVVRTARKSTLSLLRHLDAMREATQADGSIQIVYSLNESDPETRFRVCLFADPYSEQNVYKCDDYNYLFRDNI